MGHIRHHMIVVTSFSDTELRSAKERADALFPAVTDIVESPLNGFRSFFIAPDGSKEGWEDSDAGDQQRSEFVDYLRTFAYEDGSSSLTWAEVQYGDDDFHDALLNSNGLDRKKQRGLEDHIRIFHAECGGQVTGPLEGPWTCNECGAEMRRMVSDFDRVELQRDPDRDD